MLKMVLYINIVVLYHIYYFILHFSCFNHFIPTLICVINTTMGNLNRIIIMTTQAKGTLIQRTCRLLGRGYTLFTIQEIKLAQTLQRKFSFGYLLVRTLGFFTKVFIAFALVFILSWFIFIALAVFAFFVPHLTKTSQEVLEETIGSMEHRNKNPWQYDDWEDYRG